jgi:hypothetical protein
MSYELGVLRFRKMAPRTRATAAAAASSLTTPHLLDLPLDALHLTFSKLNDLKTVAGLPAVCRTFREGRGAGGSSRGSWTSLLIR